MNSVTNKFIVIGMGKTDYAIKEAFYEVYNGNIKNAVFLEPFSFPNSFMEYVYRIRFNSRTRKYFRWIPKKIWEKYYVVKRLNIDENERLFVIFLMGTDVERLLYKKVLRELKQKNGDRIQLVLALFDSIDSPLKNNDWGWNHILDSRGYFDIVATYDYKDAKKYNMLFFEDPYAKRCIKKDDSLNSIDLFFVGFNKGRMRVLNDIGSLAKKEGVNSVIIVNGAKGNQSTNIISTNKYLSYDTILSHVDKTNCLLEVLSEGQSSESLRYYEAVVYNKKLLTNNPEIVNYAYYDFRYMRVFDKPEDIDWEWVKKKEVINYHYKEDFSVKKFFKRLTDNGLIDIPLEA